MDGCSLKTGVEIAGEIGVTGEAGALGDFPDVPGGVLEKDFSGVHPGFHQVLFGGQAGLLFEFLRKIAGVQARTPGQAGYGNGQVVIAFYVMDSFVNYRLAPFLLYSAGSAGRTEGCGYGWIWFLRIRIFVPESRTQCPKGPGGCG